MTTISRRLSTFVLSSSMALCPVASAFAGQSPSASGQGQVAAKPTVQELKALVEKKDVDEAYLRGSLLRPADVPASQRREVADVFLAAARIQGADPVLAFGLVEKSVAFGESFDALVLASDLALILGETGLAGEYLDKAQGRVPKGKRDAADELAIRRGAIALVARDWETAEKAYGSVPGKSPLHGRAAEGLALVKSSREKADREAEEAAHNDLLKRMAKTNDMIDAMPVSEFDLCRAHTLAACESIRACRKVEVNCAFLLDSCPASTRTMDIPRPKLGDCAAALDAVPCDKKEDAVLRLTGSVCRGLGLRTSKELVPTEAGTPDSGKEKDGKSVQTAGTDGKKEIPPELEQTIRQIQGGALDIP